MILMMSKYRVFCTVVELGSFTQAANKLNYSQSAVSQTIKALEQELGTTLVSRQTHRLQLTRDGESYLPFLQEIAAAEARLERRKEELSQMQNSEIRLGTFTSISRTYLPPRIQAFSARYPGVHFSMRQGANDEIAPVRSGSPTGESTSALRTSMPISRRSEGSYTKTGWSRSFPERTVWRTRQKSGCRT